MARLAADPLTEQGAIRQPQQDQAWPPTSQGSREGKADGQMDWPPRAPTPHMCFSQLTFAPRIARTSLPEPEEGCGRQGDRNWGGPFEGVR